MAATFYPYAPGSLRIRVVELPSMWHVAPVRPMRALLRGRWRSAPVHGCASAMTLQRRARRGGRKGRTAERRLALLRCGMERERRERPIRYVLGSVHLDGVRAALESLALPDPQRDHPGP